MKKCITVRNLLLLVLFEAVLVSACSVTAAEVVQAFVTSRAAPVTNTPIPQLTKIPTKTPIPASPTPSPIPTATHIPASPTPSKMGYSVRNTNLEIQVVGVEKPYHIYMGKDLVFSPAAGNMFLDLGIKVTKLTDSEMPFKWSDIYLLDKYQSKWYPVWGAYEKTNMLLDPFSIEIPQSQVDPKVEPDVRIYLGDNGYLRAIFRLPTESYYYYLRFADLPLIEIDYHDQ